MKWKFSILVCGLIFFLPLGVMPETEQNTLSVAIGTQPLVHMDPARTTNRQTLVLYHNWGDTLLYRNPSTHEIVPCLAQSYRFIDPTTLEFTLRKGVLFHNQEPFTAEAVKFSLNRLKQPDSAVSGLLSALKAIKVLDAHTLRITTALPNPTILDIVANILFIYPPHYYQKVGPEKFDKHPIGTGPYRFVSCKRNRSITFKAFEGYFGEPKGKAKIPILQVKTRTEELLQLEELVNGTADLVRATNFYQQQIPFMNQEARLQVKSVRTLRTCFLVMDALGRSSVAFFKDRRVRQAINHAVNKEHITCKAFNQLADPMNSVTSPLHFGHESQVKTYAYNPNKARALLAAAGYPEGFSVDFYAGISESAAEAIVEDLKAVGIQADLHWMGGQWDRFYQSFSAGEYPLALLTWGSYSIFDASAILHPFFTTAAPGCYGTTDKVNRLLIKADQTLDQSVRKAFFSEAQKIIAREAFWVPLCTTRAVTIMNRALDFQPSVDEIDRYFTASWHNP